MSEYDDGVFASHASEIDTADGISDSQFICETLCKDKTGCDASVQSGKPEQPRGVYELRSKME